MPVGFERKCSATRPPLIVVQMSVLLDVGYLWILPMIGLRFILWLLWRHTGLGASGGWELKHVFTGILWRHSLNSPPLYAPSPEWLTSKLSTTAPVQSAGHDYSRRAQGVEKWSWHGDTPTRGSSHIATWPVLNNVTGWAMAMIEQLLHLQHIGSVCETETMSQGFCFFSSCWRAFRPNRTIMLAKLRVCSSTIIRIVCYARQQRGGAGSISAWPPFEIPSYFWKRATNN